MPLQNRVTPEGEIVAVAARGLMMGNRGGPLHTSSKVLGRRRWVSARWICCVLEFKARHREVMSPNRYTELFFLDEATALAAGHRPCFECRRHDFLHFAELWSEVRGSNERAAADVMDAVLHGERLNSDRSQRTWHSALSALPSGVITRIGQAPYLWFEGHLLRWTPEGYNDTLHLSMSQTVEVLTPQSISAVMKAGYRAGVHPSAPGMLRI